MCAHTHTHACERVPGCQRACAFACARVRVHNGTNGAFRRIGSVCARARPRARLRGCVRAFPGRPLVCESARARARVCACMRVRPSTHIRMHPSIRPHSVRPPTHTRVRARAACVRACVRVRSGRVRAAAGVVRAWLGAAACVRLCARIGERVEPHADPRPRACMRWRACVHSRVRLRPVCASACARSHVCEHARAAPHAPTDAPTRAHHRASVPAGGA